VFLVHGYTCDETTWTEQVPALAKQFRVVTLDLPGAAADVSAAGMIVYAPSAAVRRLVWVSRTGVEEPVIDETRGYLNPRLSPDGTRVVVQAGGVWILDLRRRAFELLPTQNTASNAFATWLPDGRHVSHG